MGKVKTDQPVLPSLLDRLIDEDPDRVLEPAKSTSVLLSEIKHNIRRDLENLLNTRVFQHAPLTKYRELETSLVNYGVVDFSHVQFGSEDERGQFAWTINNIIRRYEPRFKRVRVEVSPIGEDYERTIYLKISAVLMVEPDPVPLIFDSRVRTVDRSLRLKELRHG